MTPGKSKLKPYVNFDISTQRDEAKIYLMEAHKDYTVDIHTFFYYLNWETCPICSAFLIQKGKFEVGSK